MIRHFIRVIDGEETNVDLNRDFIGKDGVRHPRNVLFMWSEEDLWDELNIKVVWENEPTPILEDIMIPKEPEPPAPVAPPPEPDPPAPPAPPIPVLANNASIISKIEESGTPITDELVAEIEKITRAAPHVSTLMAYGGIAFRTLKLPNKGDYHQGHRHNYDHITNVVTGSVLCEVDKYEPKRYDAPCQITIEANHWHKFTALTDDVIYQCVYRQPDRDDLYVSEHSPYNEAPYTIEELKEKLKLIDNPCEGCDCGEQ